MWVRGLKRFSANFVANTFASHPMWVRGLKPRYSGFKVKKDVGRTLCGCVD